MLVRHLTISVAILLGATALEATSAQALTMKECSAKYKEAKAAGTLNGMKWNDFRKSQCGAEATPPPAAAAPRANLPRRRQPLKSPPLKSPSLKNPCLKVARPSTHASAPAARNGRPIRRPERFRPG